MIKISRRRLLGLIGKICAALPLLGFLAKASKSEEYDLDAWAKEYTASGGKIHDCRNKHISILLEDNRVYKGIPGSGPQHYVGQELKNGITGVVYICTTVCDDMSIWKER